MLPYGLAPLSAPLPRLLPDFFGLEIQFYRRLWFDSYSLGIALWIDVLKNHFMPPKAAQILTWVMLMYSPLSHPVKQ